MEATALVYSGIYICAAEVSAATVSSVWTL